MFEQRLTAAAFGFLILVGYTRADEASAAKAIEDVHGRITRDEKHPGKPVIAIDLSDPREFRVAVWVKDAALKHLREFKHLRTLNLSGTLITDDGMKELKELSALESLDLSRTKLTDAGISQLAGLSSLRDVNLRYVGVTDKSLAELKKHGELRSLDLGHGHITDAGRHALQ